MDLTANLAALRSRIERAGADPDRITVVAVTKTFGPEACRAALDAGVTALGENRAQELLSKSPHVTGATWHFVGRLQRNKVRMLAPVVSLWQTVDRRELIEDLGRLAPGAQVLVQVNISGEPQKGGCEPGATATLARAAGGAGLRVLGLMGIGPAGPARAARSGFRRLSGLADDLGLEVRSMGMSGDLEVAIEEGSTMVRVGRALFGPRETPAERGR